MPGVRHEAVLQVLWEQPELIRALLSGQPYRLPAGPIIRVDSKVSAARPLELFSDAVYVLGDGDDRLAVVVEAQTDPPDAEKWRKWAGYQAVTAIDNHCQAMVAVIALTKATADRCRETRSRSGRWPR